MAGYQNDCLSPASAAGLVRSLDQGNPLLCRSHHSLPRNESRIRKDKGVLLKCTRFITSEGLGDVRNDSILATSDGVIRMPPVWRAIPASNAESGSVKIISADASETTSLVLVFRVSPCPRNAEA